MALTAQDDRTVCIAAPIEFVWKELSDLDRMLAYFREVRSYNVEPGGRTATVVTEPDEFNVTGHVRVTESSALECVSFRVDVPRLQLVYRGTFRLAAEGSLATSLRYSATVACRQPEVRWRRQEMRTRTRRHVIDLTDRVVSFSENDPVVRKARERLAATPRLTTPGRERGRSDLRDGTRERMSTGDRRGSATPVVPAHRDAPWLTEAELRLRQRLRRLVEDSDPDERRTPAWATLDQLLRSLRYPIGRLGTPTDADPPRA